MVARDVKVDNTKNITLSPTVNVLHRHFHKISEKVFRSINCRKNTVNMLSFMLENRVFF